MQGKIESGRDDLDERVLGEDLVAFCVCFFSLSCMGFNKKYGGVLERNIVKLRRKKTLIGMERREKER